MNVKLLSNIGTNNTTSSWSQPIQQVTIAETSNLRYPRLVQLSNDGVRVSRPGYAVGISISALVAAAVAVEPHLSWPPVITVQPPNRSIAAGAGTTFTITATSELAGTTYQWKISTDGGSTYSNVANTGVYTGATTATLTISDVTGLNARKYLCIATNASGATTSNAGTLTVT